MFSRDRLVHPATAIALLALFLTIGGVGYAASQIGTSQIKNSAVTSKKLHSKAVTSTKIGSKAVSSTKLATNAVTNTKVANNAITGTKLVDGSVSTGKLAELSVTTGKLAELAVTTGKLADAAVTATKLADNAVTTTKIADSAVTTGKLADGSVTQGKIAPGTVVTGPGTLISSRVPVTNGNSGVTVAFLPGFGTITAACAAGTASLSYVNQTGTAPNVQYSAVNNGAPDSLDLARFNPPDGSTIPVTNTALGGIQTITWQISYAPAHVATITTTAGAALTDCIVTAQGTVS